MNRAFGKTFNKHYLQLKKTLSERTGRRQKNKKTMAPTTPYKILLKDIQPTEPLLPQDAIDAIAKHYDGTVDSMRPIRVVLHRGRYYPNDGNKRAYFSYSKGHRNINAIVDENPSTDDLEASLQAAENCRYVGIHGINDLEVVSRDEYTRRMAINDRIFRMRRRI